MSKHKDLSPWFEYLEMLQTYIEKGFLEMKLQDHEAYITRAALLALTPGDDPQQKIMSGRLPETVRCIAICAALLSQKGAGYMEHAFAIHVVEEETPHDLLFTLLITQKRLWFSPWRKSENIEVIVYQQ